MPVSFSGLRDNARGLRRLATTLGYLPIVAGLMAAQVAVLGPVFRNRTLTPKLIFRGLRRLGGIRVEFNTAAASVVNDRPVWYVANHSSLADPVVLAGNLNGMFAGKGNFLNWPLFGAFLKSVRYVGLRRTAKFNEQSRAKLIKNFNDGINMIMFPEATTSDGRQVHMFHAGLLTLLYGAKAVDKQDNEVRLEKEVVVQPLAIRVKSVSGKDARGRDDLRQAYTMHGEHNPFRQAWKRMKVKNITIEVTPLPALAPKDFPDAIALANKAAQSVADVVNPGQTSFTKAKMPRLDRKYW